MSRIFRRTFPWTIFGLVSEVGKILKEPLKNNQILNPGLTYRKGTWNKSGCYSVFVTREALAVYLWLFSRVPTYLFAARWRWRWRSLFFLDRRINFYKFCVRRKEMIMAKFQRFSFLVWIPGKKDEELIMCKIYCLWLKYYPDIWIMLPLNICWPSLGEFFL